jgi:nicotinamidase-related amidase
VNVHGRREAKAARTYHTLEQILDPRHTALVVVDMQNDLCHPHGAFGRGGLDLSDIRRVIPKIAELVAAGRRHGVLIAWLQQTRYPSGLSDAPASERMRSRYLASERCVEGTWGHQIVDELTPEPDDLVVRKHRSSGFTGTALDMLLDSNGIETVVVCGVATEGCVDSTAREALFHNYYVICATDAMASTRRDLHDAAVTIMRARYDCPAVEEVIAIWRTAPAPDR